MRSRVFVLFWLWFISFVIGLCFSVFTSNIGQISFAGKVLKEYQIGDKCISEVGRFVASRLGRCRGLTDKFVVVTGTAGWSLITLLRGKLDLVSATIDLADVKGEEISSDAILNIFLTNFANYCIGLYKQYLPFRESALLSGIVFGKKSDIGYEFYEQMVRSGTVHIAVASGFNLMLLSGFIMYPLFYLWKRKWASLVAVLFLFAYAVITGFEPPMIRAWLMISFLFLSLAFGRKQEGWWALFVSVWLILIWDVGMLWNISFQLSVAASIGLIVMVPASIRVASDNGYEREIKFLERVGFLSTFMATLLTVPIIWYHFGRVNLIGLLSNLLILPLVPPVMVLGLLMLVSPGIFYLPTYALVHMLVVLIEFFGM